MHTFTLNIIFLTINFFQLLICCLTSCFFNFIYLLMSTKIQKQLIWILSPLSIIILLNYKLFNRFTQMFTLNHLFKCNSILKENFFLFYWIYFIFYFSLWRILTWTGTIRFLTNLRIERQFIFLFNISQLVLI